MLIYWFIWAHIACISATLHFPSLESKDVKTYPVEWVKRCGDENGQILVFKEAASVFENCYKQVIDPQLLIEDFVEAHSKNKVPQFAEEKCKEMPKINDCLDAYAASIAHCFNKKEQTDMETTVNVFKATLDFVCEKDGEKILFFLQDKGFECFEAKQQQLHACINNTSKDDFNNITAPEDLSFIASVSYNPSTCQNFEDLYQCFFQVLKECPDRTPSLLLKSLNKWIHKVTPCHEGTYSEHLTQLGIMLHSSNVFLLISSIIILVNYF